MCASHFETLTFCRSRKMLISRPFSDSRNGLCTLDRCNANVAFFCAIGTTDNQKQQGVWGQCKSSRGFRAEPWLATRGAKSLQVLKICILHHLRLSKKSIIRFLLTGRIPLTDFSKKNHTFGRLLFQKSLP